ncbi:MAG TPA: valine--tRNA ligase [Candidatus Obscuribacterales bacterium]
MSTTKSPSATVEGQKGAYNPKEVESKWTQYWFEREVFDLDIIPDKPRFSCALPPPNITGSLHMGHALNGTLQDVLIRLKRMQGYNVLWQPGTDHAGISTQMVVERKLKKEGKSRRDLGREAFVEQVWKWRHEYGNTILEQYKRLGVSFNWDRLAFTMDEGYVKAIYRAFVTLYKEGFIYRGHRVTNWCPRCLTSLSDLEVEHQEVHGHLYLIKYPLVGESGGLTVATTRPESMLGDVAVAVNPEDERYKKFIGRTVKLPLTERELPVIADSYVDVEFGTGCLKITPAHDANDWEVGQRHNLPAPVVIDAEGKMLANEYVPKQFHGKDRFITRQGVVEELKQQELLVEIQDYVHGVGHCERCHTVIEPYLSDQWYLSMKELAEPAIKAVEEGRVVFIPERYASTYLDWMQNIRDWNISRQLWWGHRIPVWTCEECKHRDAFETAPEQCPQCGSKKLEQDPDVLDTWFSSALWPFATLGWPQETNELKVFYPTTILSTAREIINLWVARMIFTSLKFLKTIPFKHVLIHPVIQTPDGKRMSKSKGNAIDPLDMIDRYGADANRFWFTSVGIKGDQDVRFREDRLEEYKRFSNKLWNAGKFVLAQLEGYTPKGIEADKLTLADRWILHRYNVMLRNVNVAFNNYDFDDAAREIYDFTWDYFCDWYIEIAKIQLAQEGTAEQTRRVLHVVFEGLMRAMHPITPFITEELWSKLPKSELFTQLDSIMFAPYPREDERFFCEEAENEMSLVMKIIRSIRNTRQTFNVPAGSEADVILHIGDAGEKAILEKMTDYIKRIARAGQLTFASDSSMPPRSAWEQVASSKVIVPLGALIDVEKTREKLQQRKQAVEKDVQKTKQILDSADFRKKAPPEKVQSIESQLAELEKQLNSIDAQLKMLE